MACHVDKLIFVLWYPNPWPRWMLVRMLRIASSNTRECPGSMDLLDFRIVCLGYCIFSYTRHLFFGGGPGMIRLTLRVLLPKEDKCGRGPGGGVDVHRHQKSFDDDHNMIGQGDEIWKFYIFFYRKKLHK